MNPFEHERAYESIILGRLKSPGKVTLSGHDRERNWDIAAADGQTGASSALKGAPIGQFEATFDLLKDFSDGTDQFEEWDLFQRALDESTSGPTPKAFPIYHPDLARNHFTEVSVANVGGMIHDGKGGAIVKVKFIEYRPPKPKPPNKAKVKPGASGGADGADAPDPNQAAKDELAGLLDEAKQP